MIPAILISAILNSAILYKKNFTFSFWLNLMMAAILNSAMLDSDTAILDSNTLLSSLRFTQKHSSSTLTLTQTNSLLIFNFHDGSHLTKLWLKLVQSDSDTHLGLNLMISTILNLCHFWLKHFHLGLDWETLLSSLTQTHFIWLWLKLIQSDSNPFILILTWWCQSYSILAILDSAILVFPLKHTHTWPGLVPKLLHSFISLKKTWYLIHFVQKKLHSFILTQLDDGSYLEICHPQFSHFARKNFTHDSTWWWQPSEFCNLMMAAILNSAISGFTQKPLLLWLSQTNSILINFKNILSSFLHLPRFSYQHFNKKTLTQTSSIWLKLIHSDSTWWWQPSWILPSWIQPFCTKKTSLFHSDSTWWWQPSWILAILDSAILVFPLKLTSHLPRLVPTIKTQTHSFFLTQLDVGSHLEFCHLGFSHCAQKINFTHSFWLNLMMVAIMNSAMLDSDTAILDSDTLLSSLRFTQKHSHSILTLTQTNSIWLKPIHSHLTWWWQSSWIMPSWIQWC